MAWNMIITDSINQSKMQALSLISDCYKYQMDLISNGPVAAEAIKYVDGKIEHLNNQQKQKERLQLQQQDIKDKEVRDISLKQEEEPKTTNGVF